MAENTKISWCDHTVNLWWGCAKVHAGCKNCYAEYLSETRYQNNVWGENAPRKRILSAFKDLNKYQKRAKEQGINYTIFVGSMMDIFEENKPLNNPVYDIFTDTQSIRFELFNRILYDWYPNLIFLFLTKRPENILKTFDWKQNGAVPKNVFFGTSISNQATADVYTQRLRETGLPNLFLSVEPQIGEIKQIDLTGIFWVIQGGESGNKRRPFNLDWAYHLKDVCKANNVAYFFKQIDKILPIPNDLDIMELPDGIKSYNNGR